jgi:hypothetical protein
VAASTSLPLPASLPKLGLPREAGSYPARWMPVAAARRTGPAPVAESAAWRRRSWERVYHVYNPERFSQSRGITALAPVLNVEGIRNDLEFVPLIKHQPQAYQ